jgi:hypothetical protein
MRQWYLVMEETDWRRDKMFKLYDCEDVKNQ